MSLSSVAAPETVKKTPAPSLPVLNRPWFETPHFPRLLEESGLDGSRRELVKNFAEQGYVVIDPELGEVDQIADQVIRDLAPRYQGTGRLQDAWIHNEAVKRIATAPKILETLETLYRRKPIPFQTLNFPRGTEQATHSDTIHFHSMPAGFMCAVWVALEDIDAQNGPLHYYPKSHKLPILDYNDLGIGSGLPPEAPALRATFLGAPQPLVPRSSFWRALRHLGRRLRRKLRRQIAKAGVSSYDLGSGDSAALYKRYEEVVRILMLETGLERAEVSLRKGQAFIWSANLFHGGSPIRDRARSRHTQVTHYYFSDCMYYTPLMSAPHLGKYYMRKVRHVGTGEVARQFYNGIEIDTEDFNE
jgi:ectoine hydroxylase-related dioxygenase (phytanoyl-CoA dioxygenase family)